jgi:mono/diheme cytochrome c family protein
MGSFKFWQRFLLILALLMLVGVGLAGYLASARQPASTPFVRGFYLAQRMGCFSCHGPQGIAGATNPNALWGETPPFSAGGPILSFVQQSQEIREWILYGAPQRLWIDGQQPDVTATHQHKHNKDSLVGVGGTIKMPAFAGILTDAQLNDLVFFVQSMTGMYKPADSQAVDGLHVAMRMGCFGCHGPGGRGGTPNPGSFKGYIPPWDGDDFKELVEDESELRQWVLDGKLGRFERNPLARYFTHGQSIRMPAYRGVMTEQEFIAIKAYIEWLRDPNKKVAGHWVSERVPSLATMTERGQWLYRHSGCVACHGANGKGGLKNANALGGYVPALDDLAEKIGLFEPQDVDTIVAILDRGLSLDDPAVIDPVPDFDIVRTQFLGIRKVILKGAKPGARQKEKPKPPMLMPAWEHRLYSDGSPPSRVDIDAIIAYLITQQSFDEEDG